MSEFRDGDRVAVMSFNEKYQLELPLTRDLNEARRRVGTGLADAPFGSSLPSRLAAADASVKYRSGSTGAPAWSRNHVYLGLWHGLEAGQLLNFSVLDSIAASHPNDELRRVMRRMRSRYKLYYDRPTGKPGQRRQIEVTLSPATEALHPEARILSRKGYVVPK